jgi:Transglycosylase SLT domain
LLAVRPARREATIGALPSGLRPAALDIAEAGASLRAGLGRVTSDGPITMRTRAPLPPDDLLAIYRKAARRFGVPWNLLAAINFVESKFGRVISPSWAGAQGPMQFIPSTWVAYGMGGDVRDTHDAILGAANYLRANGAPEHTYGAVFAYNPVDWYVDAVLHYARHMARDPAAFYELYNWQVFVRLRSGPVQVTGPGADPQST